MIQAAAQETGDNVTGQDENQKGEYLVRARCEIAVGDECSVYFPGHDDNESLRFHRACHKQTAVVHALRRQADAVDIKMMSGPRMGDVFVSVSPWHLIFDGSYVKKKL